MDSDVAEPINLGSAQLVTINELVDIVEEIAGVQLERRYNLDAPQGVSGRNSDNTLIKARLGWEPAITLEDGLEQDVRLDLRRDGDSRCSRGPGPANSPERVDADRLQMSKLSSNKRRIKRRRFHAIAAASPSHVRAVRCEAGPPRTVHKHLPA